MPATNLAALSIAVLAATFALAFAFGAIVQRTKFCTMGSVADVVSFGDWTRMRQWLLAIAVALLGTTLLDAAGLIDVRGASTRPRASRRWLMRVGGVLFGFGMVLAGGCGSNSVVRAGGGSLKSLVVVLVLAVVAYITLRGALALLRVGVLERGASRCRRDRTWLRCWLAAARRGPPGSLALGLGISAALVAFTLRERSFRTFDNLLAGIGIGAVIVGVWFVSGSIGHLAEHPQTLEEAFLRTNSRQMESLSFVAPVAWTLDYLMFTSDASKEVTIGIVAVVGMFFGSATYALATGRFRWEGFRDTEDTGNHLVGAALMGFGGVTALGCTIGQGLSGVSTLAAGSFIALAGIVVGAVAGVRYQAWRIERTSA